MKSSDFHYDLPDELIAQHPLPQRTASRLLCLDRESGEVRDRKFTDLPDLLRAGDLMVFNDTRVIPARLYARKETGGRVEVLVERLLTSTRCTAQLRASKSPKPGSYIVLESGERLRIEGREGDFYVLELGSGKLPAVLEAGGHVPLPPYIRREDTGEDAERYQTVFARRPGAVAAPTAGLHFDEEVLESIEERGVERAQVTLHVGAGTFQPVRTERIEDHVMHAESLEVSEDVVDAVERTRARGGRVVAVGTTTVRSLETAAADGELRAFSGDSRLFIYPGYDFRVVDALLTNFHLPESTLLMLASAFAGRETVLAAYRHAVAERYRFFSYGDAMFLT